MDVACKQRVTHLKEYHKECENLSLQTKKVENNLKEKETARYNTQVDKEKLEKQLIELNEKNMAAQNVNYRLSFQYRFFSQKHKKQTDRVYQLNDKISFLNENITSALKQQQERATKQDVEYQALTSELASLKVTFQSNLNDLNTVEDSNLHHKKQKYEMQIEQLNRKL